MGFFHVSFGLPFMGRVSQLYLYRDMKKTPDHIDTNSLARCSVPSGLELAGVGLADIGLNAMNRDEGYSCSLTSN